METKIICKVLRPGVSHGNPAAFCLVDGFADAVFEIAPERVLALVREIEDPALR